MSKTVRRLPPRPDLPAPTLYKSALQRVSLSCAACFPTPFGRPPQSWPFSFAVPVQMGGSSNRIEDFSGVLDLESSLPVSALVAIPPVEIHKVSVPPKRGAFQALKQRLGEVFFPDDPLHQFEGQTVFRKLVLALQYFFPIFQWGSEYSLSLLKSDAVSGLTIASLAIPQVSRPVPLPFSRTFN